MRRIQRLTAAVLAAVLLMPVNAGAVSFPESPDLLAGLLDTLPAATTAPEATEENTEPRETEASIQEILENGVFAEPMMAGQPGDADPEWTLYFGLLHAHTDLSDGQGSVEEAFSYASQVENLDFFAVTDHSNSFDNADAGSIVTDGSSVSAEWARGKAAAAAVTDETFVGIFGYEMTWQEGWEIGHINTFATPGWQSRNQPEFSRLKNYYQALTLVPESVSQFNHPGPGYGEFENFAYHSPEYDRAMALLEVGGEGGFTAYRYYTKALDKGWHVAPTNSQNNHNGAWGDASSARTVVLAKQLTEESLYDAMRQRRVYATEDADFSISYRLDGQIMGGFVPRAAQHRAKIRLLDPTDTGTVEIEVIVDGGRTVASGTGEADGGELTLTVPGGYAYYYLRITQADGNIAVTAPVWTEDSQDVGIASFAADTQVPTAEEPMNLNLELYNGENRDLVLSGLTLFAWEEQIYELAEPGTVAANSRLCLSIPYTAREAGTIRFRAVVTGRMGEEDKVFETSLTLSFRPGEITADILVDGSHGAKGTEELKNLAALAKKAGMTVGVFREEMPEEGQILVILPPEQEFSEAFLRKAAAFSQKGGAVVLCGTASSELASGQLNRMLEALGSTMRLQTDSAVDEIHNGGTPDKLYPTMFNAASSWCDGITRDQVYSHDRGCTIIPGNGTWLVRGHSTTSSRETGEKSPVLLAAETLISGGAVLLAGSPFLTDSAMPIPANRWDAPRINYSVVRTLLGIQSKNLSVTDIRRVRRGDAGSIYRIKGYVTSGTANKYNTFSDALYLEDDTGGIGVIHFTDPGLALGTPVEVIGRLDEKDGNPVLDLIDYRILEEDHRRQVSETVTLKQAMDYANRGGSLVQVEAWVYSVTLTEDKQGISRFTLMDEQGSRAVVMIEENIQSGSYGTNTLASQVKVGRRVRARGIVHLDGNGVRVLRVRNCEEVAWVPPVPRPGDNPPTGDSMLSAVAVLMASAALLGLLMRKRKTR